MKRSSFLAIVSLVALSGAFSVFASSEKSNVGQQLPELKVDYLAAKPETAGKPMIVEFWATWCPPCRTSIPHLNEIYKKNKDKGLVVIGITNEDRAKVEAFTKKTPIDYSAAIDAGGSLSKGFGVRGIPHAMLVDKSGKIVWEGHPMSLNDAEIDKILK